MSEKKACMKALDSLDYGTAVTIGSYIGELENKVKQLDKIKQLSNVEELTLADFAKEVFIIIEGRDTPPRNKRE
jgi:hypothetical protein